MKVYFYCMQRCGPKQNATTGSQDSHNRQLARSAGIIPPLFSSLPVTPVYAAYEQRQSTIQCANQGAL